MFVSPADDSVMVAAPCSTEIGPEHEPTGTSTVCTVPLAAVMVKVNTRPPKPVGCAPPLPCAAALQISRTPGASGALTASAGALIWLETERISPLIVPPSATLIAFAVNRLP